MIKKVIVQISAAFERSGEKRREADAGPHSPVEKQPSELIQAAQSAQAAREWAEAHDLWESVVVHQPDDVGALLQLGNMKTELKRYTEAITIFRRAADLQPRSFDAAVGVAGVFEREGQWTAACQEWESAVPLAALEQDTARLHHAWLHATQAAFLSRDGALLTRVQQQAARICPDIFDTENGRYLRARIIAQDCPQEAQDIISHMMEVRRDDDAMAYDLASICLSTGDYRKGVEAIHHALMLRPDEPSFLWLAADLHDRLHHWKEVLGLCERLVALPGVDERSIQRAFEVAVRASDLVAARRFARMRARMRDGELDLIDRLRNAYEQTGDLRSARLICRWLTRRWPHSHWHVGQLIVLTADTLGLVAADTVVRSFVGQHGRLPVIDRAYCRAAFAAYEHLEAHRRLEWLLKTGKGEVEDTESRLLLGYVIANASGIEVAEHYFLTLASSTFQSEGALVGIAHMASRRRDHRALIDLWSKISVMYPGNTIARVEAVRALYNAGQIDRALKGCRARLRDVPSDVTMAEFHAWLLIASARFEEAAVYVEELHELGGPSWTGLEVAIHALGMLNRLDERWSFVENLIPFDTSREGGSRFYHVTRLLLHFERHDLAERLMQRTHLQPRNLVWAAAYADASRVTVDPTWVEPAHTALRRIKSLVSEDVARSLRRMSDTDVDLAIRRPRHRHPTVHVINKFEQARGGSELHALDLASRLSAFANVEIWAPEMPHPHFTLTENVIGIDHSQGRTPSTGVFVFIGVYFSIKWLSNTCPDRIIFLYNTFEAPMVYDRILEAHAMTGVRPELLFCSDMMGHECGLPGLFEPSPIDIGLFRAAEKRDTRPFTLGRHSRDVVEKHHVDDAILYETVARAGGHSTLLGGTCMKAAFENVPSLELRPAQNDGIVEYLQGLDAYLYRTSTWVEPWGRVVVEAMACELPVLTHDIGGYVEIIKHEQNGLLFHTNDEAIRLLRRLMDEPKLRKDLGSAARQTVEQLLGPQAMNRLALFYLLRRGE